MAVLLSMSWSDASLHHLDMSAVCQEVSTESHGGAGLVRGQERTNQQLADVLQVKYTAEYMKHTLRIWAECKTDHV